MKVGVNNGSATSNSNPMQEVVATVGGEIRISDATNDVETLINAADALDQVTVQDMGTTVGVFIENEDTGAQDIIV